MSRPIQVRCPRSFVHFGASSVAVAALAVLVSSCGGSPTTLTATTTTLPNTTTTKPGSTTTTNPSTLRTSVLYFLRGSTLGVSDRTGPSTADPRYAALVALVSGTVPAETAAGLATDIPAGTTVRGLQIKAGVATANLSPQYLGPGTLSSLQGRLAQIVYTLTAFPNVSSVVIEVGGQRIPNLAFVSLANPITRSQVTASLPGVLLEQPAVGGNLKSKLTISGLTSINGTYDVQLSDSSGKLLASATNTAVVGGTFQQSIPFTITAPEVGTIKVFSRPSKPSQAVQEFQFSLPISP
jgi:spore germination protein GerM